MCYFPSPVFPDETPDAGAAEPNRTACAPAAEGREAPWCEVKVDTYSAVGFCSESNPPECFEQ